MIARKWLITILLFTASQWVKADDIYVAVASNFTAVMHRLAEEFEKSSGHQLKISSGSSGKFYAQIKHGAPFDVFFSADQAKPQALENEGLIVANSRFSYAVGALALWSAQPGWVDDQATRLKNNNFNKLALANPKLAPYGAAAVEVLDNLKLVKTTQPKWVKGENIAQTYQFASTGNADIGFVALSQIMHNGHIKHGSAWIIPDQLYSPILQDAVLLKRAANNDAAKALLQFMRSNIAKKIIESYGYKTLVTTQ